MRHWWARRQTTRSLVAAITAAVLVGCSSSGPSSNPTSTGAEATATATTTPTAPPAPTSRPVAPTTAQAPTSVPTTVAQSDLATVIVDPEAIAYAPLTRTVLYRASIGTGVDQLFVEPCQECDPQRPWAPLVASDGTIVIVDAGRLVVVQNGVPSVVPLPSGLTMIGSPLLVDDRVYLPTATADPAVGQLQTLSIADLRAGTYRVLETHEIPGQPDVWVRAEGDEIKANDTAALEVTGSTRPRIEFALNETPARLTVSHAGGRRTWELPTTWSMNKGWALSDGSVVSIAITQDQRTLAVQLLADGLALAGAALGESYSYDGTPSVDDGGIVQLERVGDTLEVARYPLPAATT